MRNVNLCVSVVCLDPTGTECATVLERHDNKTLVNIPTGHSMKGESPDQTAYRILAEQTGIITPLNIQSMHLAGTVLMPVGTEECLTMVYVCDVNTKQSIAPGMSDKDIVSAVWADSNKIRSFRSLHINELLEPTIKMGLSSLMAYRHPLKRSHSPWHLPWITVEDEEEEFQFK